MSFPTTIVAPKCQENPGP